MEFSNWLKQAFENWRSEQEGLKKTVTEFARYIGITQDMLMAFLNGEKEPEGTNLAKIAVALGSDAYKYLGCEHMDFLECLPTPIRIQFLAAFSEFVRTVKEKDLHKESPEAKVLLIEKLKQYQLNKLFE